MRPNLGVCYCPEHWQEVVWRDDARRMAEAGLRFVRIGEFSWSQLEPGPEEFEAGWLLRAMDVLHDAGLSVVLGTPTAAPPRWVVDRMPDMVIVDAEGRRRGFGSRRHYDFSHAEYRAEAPRVTSVLAEAVGEPSGALSLADRQRLRLPRQHALDGRFHLDAPVPPPAGVGLVHTEGSR